MTATDLVLAAGLTGASKGHVETVVATVAVIVIAVLLVIGLLLLVIRRGHPGMWLGAGVVAIIASVLALSFV